MTDKMQNMVIAEANGWKFAPHLERNATEYTREEMAEAIMCWVPPGLCHWQPKQLSNYVEDLNEMLKIKNRLAATLRDDFQMWLSIIVERKHRMATNSWLCLTATAAEEAEAYLRTIKLWV